MDLREIGWKVGSCERFNDPSGSINDGEFLDYLSHYQPIFLQSPKKVKSIPQNNPRLKHTLSQS
jgi:hypothetical protein